MPEEHPFPYTFEDLDPEVQKWLRNARAQDVRDLDESIALQRNLRFLGKFARWIIYAIIAGVAASATFGNNVVQLIKLMKGSP